MKVAVFCGSSMGKNEKYQETAVDLTKLFIEKKWDLVYGGANVGLMGVIANEILRSNKCEVYGVIPKLLYKWEVAHEGLKHLEIVDSMHERKKKMYEMASIFIIFPGGIGTMDEFFETLTWKQLKEHNKEIYILNIYGYFDRLLGWLNFAHEEGFFGHGGPNLFKVVSSVKELKEKVG